VTIVFKATFKIKTINQDNTLYTTESSIPQHLGGAIVPKMIRVRPTPKMEIWRTPHRVLSTKAPINWVYPLFS